ncbi:MAG: tetratricopeptide repeat protein [Acidobacteriota bacterium]|jgi:tetratricopeptide (TPR) repeat protein
MSQPPARPGAAAWTALVALIALYAAFGAFQAYDYDLPLHLITGEQILKDFRAAEENQFSFTYPGYRWLNDKWLENILVHLVDRLAGPPGLVTARLLLVLLLGLLLWRTIRAGAGPEAGRGTPVIAALLLAFPFVAYERFTLRPELFSLLGIAALLGILIRDARGPREWLLVGGLLAVWVNLHGYWFVAILVLGAFLAGDLLESWMAGGDRPGDATAARARARHRGLLLGCALAGALISPYPIRLFLNPFMNLIFVFEEQGNAGTIAELMSPFAANVVRNWAIWFFYGMAAALLLLAVARRRRVRPADVFLVLGFFLMASVSRRNIGMFAVVGIAVAGWWLLRPGGAAGGGRRRPAALATAAIAALAMFLAWFVVTDRFYASDGTSRRTGFSMSRLTYPAGLADFLLRERPPGPFFNDFASGSYLAYRLFPEYRVFISGNTFKYPPEFFRRYYITSLGREEYREVAADYGLRGFALMYGSGDAMPLARKLFNDPDYVPVYFDDNALLYVRRLPEMEPFIQAHRVDFEAIARRRAAEPVAAPAGWLARHSAPRGELNRATFLHRVGLFPMAEVEYRRALQQSPDLLDAAEGLGEVLLGQGRFAEAAEVLEPLRERRPRRAHLQRDLAQVRSGLGSQAAAAERWRDARGQLEAALADLETMRRLAPEEDAMVPLEAANRFNLGFVLLRDPDATPADRARGDRELDAAVSLQPQDATLLFRVARVRARRGQPDQALDLLARSVGQGGPEIVGMALRDPAFAALRADPRFREILRSGTD